MKILVACEFSGIVRDAFVKKGHEVWSCDLLDTEIPGNHYKGDVFDILYFDWDMMLAFPPCTNLAVSGARWFKEKWRDGRIQESLNFVRKLLNVKHIKKICLENPVGLISTYIRKPDQYIQPYEFGHGETKKTGLWLKNLPKLVPTNIVSERKPRVHYESPGVDRWKNRSRFYEGIAVAMAEQWGGG